MWVDLCGPSKDQLHELAGELGLHEFAVEDAMHAHQRPKLDRYAAHLFLSTAIIAVPALVTGYYGMNVPYPGSGETWGVVTFTFVMAVAAFILYRVFRRHDWL